MCVQYQPLGWVIVSNELFSEAYLRYGSNNLVNVGKCRITKDFVRRCARLYSQNNTKGKKEAPVLN